MQPRPTAAELLEAVREWIQQQDSFEARVAANALGIVERELTLGPALHEAERARLRDLLGREGTLEDLNGALAAAIRDGTLDASMEEVVSHLRQTARDKLHIANPKWLQE